MIDPQTVQRIKDAADIVEVVSDYVTLVRRGANYMGLCPFHNERTPSFSVNRKRNFCYCFSCHKGGSPVNFIMEKEGISYHDALLQLAAKYNIKVEERELTDEEQARQTRRDAMLNANEWAMRKMEHDLTGTDEGRDVGLEYLRSRGLTDEAIRKFRLGYALDKPDALGQAAAKEGYSIDVLKETGLLGTSQQGKTYDRFRSRVIFPIINTSGKVIAFGGRDLKGVSPAKYINSPESVIYKKSNELYGIYQARNAIDKQDKCFLVEGYMDVIGMWQSGLENVVASSGTALTDGQIALIHRFTNNVTLIYDGDNAGIHASLRGMDMLLSHGMNVKLLLLPDGHDPDSFARANTPEQFREYVAKNETDIIRFKAKILMEQSEGDPQKRAEAIRSIVQSIACIIDPVTRRVYVQECARLTGLDETTLARATATKNREIATAAAEAKRKQKEYDRIERMGKTDPVSPAGDPASRGTEQPKQTATVSTTEPPKTVTNPLEPFEREIVRYCARYGMVSLPTTTEDGAESSITIAEYVKAEMEADGVTFATPAYASTFDAVLSMVPQFLEDYTKFIETLTSEIEAEKRKRWEELADQASDSTAIRNAEEKIESEMREKYDTSLSEWCIDYAPRLLASHPDDMIRNTSVALIADHYTLSKYHKRTGQVSHESDMLEVLIPRALSEWKDGIIAQRIAALRLEIAQAVQAGDAALVADLQRKATRLIALRKEVALQIGERIIPGK